jgi:MSHA pilin protein MshA
LAGAATPTTKCVKLVNCQDVGALMQGGIPTNYSVTSLALSTSNGTTASCTVALSGYTPTANFTSIAAGN